LNKTTIHLPIEIDERHRSQLKHVQLYVKDGPTVPWKMHTTVPPTQASFTYKAPGEGEFWFNIVSVDLAGRMTPADVSKEAPALVVVLDTTAPQVEVQVLHSAPEGLHVRCESRDSHLDAFKSRFFYQTGDQVWRTLDALPGKADTFCIPTQAAWNGNIRVHAVDLAGNATTREMNLSAAAATAPANAAPSPVVTTVPTPERKTVLVPLPTVEKLPKGPAAPAQSSDAADLVLPPVPSDVKPPLTSAASKVPVAEPVSPDVLVTALPPAPASTAIEPGPMLPLPPVVTQATPDKAPSAGVVSKKPAPQLFDPTVAAASAPLAPSTDVKPVNLAARDLAAAQRQHLSTTRLFLDYRLESLGASGVGRVEVWCTRDLGQSWQKLCEDADRQSPVDVNLPGEGIFGLSLVVSNGRGFGALPPNPGDTPDYWVEVDTTKPIADLIQVRHGTGDDSGALQIVWSVREKNLGPDAIELQFGPSREGPWQPVAKGLKSEGVYRWVPPTEVGSQTYLRLTARDLAGNVATAETVQPVLLDDLSRPRARVVGLSTSAPRTSPQP
jgi:hypothetical protein